MAQCKVLLNSGDYLLLNTGDNVLLNDNTCSESQAHGIWEGPLAPAEYVKPWKGKKEKIKESTLELLIVAEPVMGQVFKKDLESLPYLKTYEDQLYDVLFTPIKNQTFDEFKLEHQVYKEMPYLNAELHVKYESPNITIKPVKEQMFRKTFYGEKLYGVALINMVKNMMGVVGDVNIDSPQLLSFEFNDRDLVDAVTNKPPVGKPEEQEREQEFNQPSSFIGTVIYSPDIQTMEIELNGNVYNYCNVPQRIYESFEGAGSKGEFYNREIRGIYTC